MDRPRAARFVLLLAGLGGAWLLARAHVDLPRDQSVRYVLGDEAARVEQVDARWGHEGSGGFDRDATFNYAPGQAPRAIAHAPHMPNGDYDVRIAVVAGGKTRTVDRHVQLAGGSTSIDLTRAVPQ